MRRSLIYALAVIVVAALWFPAALLTVKHEPESLPGCHSTDGDSLTCGRERIRLNGIDTPEIGEPQWGEAGKSLDVAIALGPLTIDRLKQDRYGRTVGQVRAGDTDLSCWQLEMGLATYKPDWDEGERTRAQCPEVAR